SLGLLIASPVLGQSQKNSKAASTAQKPAASAAKGAPKNAEAPAAVQEPAKPGAASTKSAPLPPTNDVLLQIMEAELGRAAKELAKADPPPYFTSYSVEDEDVTSIVSSNGALLNAVHTRRRTADISMRVGSPELDNTHGDN